MSVPCSVIYIVGDVPLDNRYEHSLYFSNPTEQREYFRNKTIHTFNGYTYLRKNWSIKVEATMEQAHSWSYLYFYNQWHENKCWYYFINKVSYVNDNTVELDLELDVIQSYMFDWKMGQCFVERQHVFNDLEPHTVDEGLETGELVNLYTYDVQELTSMCIMVLSTTEDENSYYGLSHVYDGVFSGLKVSAVQYEDYEQLGVHLEDLSVEGKDGQIVSMWMYPKSLVRIKESWGDKLFHTVLGIKHDFIEIPDDMWHLDLLIDGYSPHNYKLFTYPYRMLYVTNNNGNSAVYRYERFRGRAEFKCCGAVSPDAGVKIYPINYNGENGSGFDEGITLPSFPACAWDSDVYKVWLAQNQNTQNTSISHAKYQMGMSATNGILGALGSAMSLNLGGVASSALGSVSGMADARNQIDMIMSQRRDMDIQPAQSRGTFSGSVNVANGKQTFTFILKTISKEYAQMIDNYFTRYGYKINRVITPSLCQRKRFTYLKTVGCTVSGPIGTEDRIKIESVFDKGITFWADHDHVLDYRENIYPNTPLSEVD